MLIDSKQLQGFVQDIEMLRDLLRPSTSAQSSAKQAKSASGQAFAELLAEVEKSAHDTSVSQASPLVQQLLQANGLLSQDNLLPLGSISVPSVPAPDVKGLPPCAVWGPVLGWTPGDGWPYAMPDRTY